MGNTRSSEDLVASGSLLNTSGDGPSNNSRMNCRLLSHLVQQEEHRRAKQVLDWILLEPQFQDTVTFLPRKLCLRPIKATSTQCHSLSVPCPPVISRFSRGFWCAVAAILLASDHAAGEVSQRHAACLGAARPHAEGADSAGFDFVQHNNQRTW